MNSPRLSCYRKGLGKAHIKFLPWSSGPGETSTLRGRLRPWRRGARRNGCIRRLISKQLFISQKILFPIPAFPVRRIRLGLLSSSAARKNISWLSLTPQGTHTICLCSRLLSYFEKIAHMSVVWAYVSLWLCIFVSLYVQMFVARANKVKGTMSWCLGTNEILAST